MATTAPATAATAANATAATSVDSRTDRGGGEPVAPEVCVGDPENVRHLQSPPAGLQTQNTSH